MDMTRRLLPIVCIMGLAFCAGSAFPWSGSLSTATGGLQGGGGWTNAILSWDVTEVSSGVYQYEYCLDTQSKKNISHVLLELTNDEFYGSFTYPSTDMFGLEYWNGTAWVAWAPHEDDVKWYTPGSSGNSNPALPGDIFGVKFTPQKDASSLCWRFQAQRNPVWGDFYAKDGKDGGAWTYLYNTGFTANDTDPTVGPHDGSEQNHILRPNGPTAVTPELPPSALMGLGMVPLGLAYLRGRRRQES